MEMSVVLSGKTHLFQVLQLHLVVDMAVLQMVLQQTLVDLVDLVDLVGIVVLVELELQDKVIILDNHLLVHHMVLVVVVLAQSVTTHQTCLAVMDWHTHIVEHQHIILVVVEDQTSNLLVLLVD
jgi:hypothetical protein